MATSVQPLVWDYSFQANRTQATDKVDLAQLDAALQATGDKLNEILSMLDKTLRDDDTLDDRTVEPRHLHPETLAEIVSAVNSATDTQP
jgi:hypothetical protein